MSKSFVKPITCSRCKGEGFLMGQMVVFAGVPGGCYKCEGHGVVESDKATIAAAKARQEAIQAMANTAFDALIAGGVPRHRAMAIFTGIDHLRTEAPARYDAALASFAAGHPGLVRALWVYTAEAGFIHYGGRTLTVDEALAELS